MTQKRRWCATSDSGPRARTSACRSRCDVTRSEAVSIEWRLAGSNRQSSPRDGVTLVDACGRSKHARVYSRFIASIFTTPAQLRARPRLRRPRSPDAAVPSAGGAPSRRAPAGTGRSPRRRPGCRPGPGAAIGRMISEATPLAQSIGARPMTTVPSVSSLGRSRWTAPFEHGLRAARSGRSAPGRRPWRPPRAGRPA